MWARMTAVLALAVTASTCVSGSSTDPVALVRASENDVVSIPTSAPSGIARAEALLDDARASDVVIADLGPTTSVSTTTTTAAPATTVVPATSTTGAPVATGNRWTTTPYRGSGAWVDVYDWTLAYTKGRPTVTLASIDRMAALGVETLYLQTARTTSDADIDEPERLRSLIDRAHANGLFVVAWYLPTLEDLDKDERRLLAAARLDVDGLSVNLESTAVADVPERNRRMIELSRRVDAALPGEPLATVILNPFAVDVLVPHVWPDFPWAELDPFYDVWQPMIYVTYRPDDDPYRNSYEYTRQSMRHMRGHAPDEPIHPVTGIADEMTMEDVRGFARASREEGAVGGGIYDWATSSEAMWAEVDDLGA